MFENWTSLYIKGDQIVLLIVLHVRNVIKLMRFMQCSHGLYLDKLCFFWDALYILSKQYISDSCSMVIIDKISVFGFSGILMAGFRLSNLRT